MDIFYSIVEFFSRGGVFMLPILFVGALGVAIALERFITLTRMSIRNRGMWATLAFPIGDRKLDWLSGPEA